MVIIPILITLTAVLEVEEKNLTDRVVLVPLDKEMMEVLVQNQVT